MQGDSSVTPFTVDLSTFPNINVYRNYNFAIARVRLRGTAGPSGAAHNARVFFRLWSTQTADTDYQPASTYPSTPDAAGQPGSPSVGAGHTTLPFFATGNLSGNTDYAPGGPNIRDIQINTGDNVWAYYGCFLNLYDAANVIDGRAVQSWLTGTHHCLVAQIAFDDAPVIPGASPQSSDKLAQRNLQVTGSDNPGPADTHRIPQTFDVRPTAAVVTAGGAVAYPDELMIDWGIIPPGSVASIYWPQVSSSDVLALASSLYGSHTLSAADANTIQCTVGGVTYVPIPVGTGENFAGLFTLDLPTTITTGQEFNLVVRRISSRPLPPPINPPSSPPSRINRKQEPVPPTIEQERQPGIWRYVVGTFQVKIPVATGETMLLPETNTLAIMKWRLQQMEPANRWYPVLVRYIGYIAARVDGLGGDSTCIEPSPDGVPGDFVKGREREYTGKVCDVLFDCFGDFEGFVLTDCHRFRTFRSRRCGIADVAIRACKDQLPLSVYVRGGDDCEIVKLVLRC